RGAGSRSSSPASGPASLPFRVTSAVRAPVPVRWRGAPPEPRRRQAACRFPGPRRAPTRRCSGARSAAGGAARARASRAGSSSPDLLRPLEKEDEDQERGEGSKEKRRQPGPHVRAADTRLIEHPDEHPEGQQAVVHENILDHVRTDGTGASADRVRDQISLSHDKQNQRRDGEPFAPDDHWVSLHISGIFRINAYGRIPLPFRKGDNRGGSSCGGEYASGPG